jgi:hypothetical protein
MHLGNVITVVAQDPSPGARVGRGSDVIVFVDYGHDRGLRGLLGRMWPGI